MSQEKIIHLIPYAGSLGISLGLLFYVWRWRSSRGAFAFFWYTLGQTLYIFGNTMETVSAGLGDKLFWESFQWCVSVVPLAFFPIFVTQYTESRFRRYKRLYALLMAYPVFFVFMVLTDPWHRLIYLDPGVIQGEPFSVLVYKFSPVALAYSAYVYFIALAGCVLLLQRMREPHNLYRIQTGFILVGLLLPIAGSILSLAGVSITDQRDASPFTVAVGNILLAWGLFRFRIFEVSPIPRDRVFEALADPVVILDANNNVVDINSAMLDLMDKAAGDVIGKPAKAVFDNFPIPIKMYTHVSYARTEAVFEINHKQIHYELTIWPLYNAKREMTGRIYISHDITALKELESELRKLNTKLEDRVQERTHELEEAYESLLEGMARALELRDRETEGHSRRVTENALKIAQKMGIQGRDLDYIRSGSILHDIGKISIPDEILHKKGKLTPEERVIIEQHPTTAFKLLSSIPILSKAIEIPYFHHEKWDGTGYPQKLKGDEIPLAARIFAVADVWDALSNDRPYNKARAREQIIEYFKEQTGLHFDPIIARLFLSMVEKGEI